VVEIEFPRIPYTGSPVSEKTSSETVRKVPIGFNLKPQKTTKRVEEALLHCWRTAIRRLYTPL
jgi:hypothetical protein